MTETTLLPCAHDASVYCRRCTNYAAAHPSPREARLEKALREIADYTDKNIETPYGAALIARKALEER